jgi:hypothetical protein
MSIGEILCYCVLILMAANAADYIWRRHHVRAQRYRVQVFFCEARVTEDYENGASVTVVRHPPLVWDTTLPFEQIRRHVPPIGSVIDGKIVGAWRLDPR